MCIVKHMSTLIHIHAYMDVHKCLHLICAFSELFSLESTEFGCVVIKMKASSKHAYKISTGTNLRELILRIEEQT